ncbi:MAG TPA: hypothetical protein VGC79_24065 [Polyangiaceae bacterium]
MLLDWLGSLFGLVAWSAVLWTLVVYFSRPHIGYKSFIVPGTPSAKDDGKTLEGVVRYWLRSFEARDLSDDIYIDIADASGITRVYPERRAHS